MKIYIVMTQIPTGFEHDQEIAFCFQDKGKAENCLSLFMKAYQSRGERPEFDKPRIYEEETEDSTTNEDWDSIIKDIIKAAK